MMTLNSEISIPMESIPLSLASTSIVPDPQKGSSTTFPSSKYLDKKYPTSCGMNFPRYGCSLCTCLVLSLSGTSRKASEASAIFKASILDLALWFHFST